MVAVTGRGSRAPFALVKRALKIVGVTLGLFLVAVLGLGYFLFSGLCENTVIQSRISPDGKRKIVLFERNCGATTGFTSQISILTANRSLGSNTGNIFIADGYPEGYTMIWESDTSVVIGGTKGRPYKSVSLFDGVQVRYE